jgi:hypothetical protein
MHAAHIGILETLSAAPPPKVSGAAYPSAVPESFGLTWQKEMNARATNANDMNAAMQSKASGEVASGTITQDKAITTQSAEGKAVEDLAEETLSEAMGSGALNIAPKTAVDSKAGVEGGQANGAEVSFPATPDEPSVSSKPALPGVDRESSATAREKEKNAVAKPVHGSDPEPAATLGSRTTVSAAPELMAQVEVGQTVGTPIATASGVHTKSNGGQAEHVHGSNPELAATLGSRTTVSATPELMAQVEVGWTVGTPIATASGVHTKSNGGQAEHVVEKPAQTAGESTATTTRKGAAAENGAAMGNIVTPRREATAGRETTADTALEPGAKLGKRQAVAATRVSASVSNAGFDGSQSASTVVQSVSSGMTDVAVQRLASGHMTVSSAGAELRSDAANIAEGAVGKGHQVMAAGPAQLDVGVFDGTHGWLRIRAELGAGGAVNASLTTSASAHDAVKAAIPEMASYLQSEAVNVSRIAVHRVAESASSMSMSPEGSRQGGDAQGHREARDGAGATQRSSTLENGDGSRSASGTVSSATGESVVGVAGFRDWNGGFSDAMPWIGAALGSWAGGRGSWLNVSA